MLELLFSHPFAFIVLIGAIALAISIHEAAHAFAADYLGDPTPRSLGRTTLNPLAHLDPLGTLVIILTGFFGWGKPAPFDPYNLAHPRRDTALIALAGPVSNLLLAVGLSLILRFLPLPSTLDAISYLVIRLNIGLALFNLLPVPPLDGSKIFLRPNPLVEANSLLLLLLIILPIFAGHSIASLVISPIARWLLDILI